MVMQQIANLSSAYTRRVGSIPTPSARQCFNKEKAMKRKLIARQRNRFVALALMRKAGAHRKSNKALRRQHNASLAQMVEQ